MANVISVIPGDGIGPVIVKSAIKVLEATSEIYGFKLSFVEAPAGDAAKRDFGEPLPKSSFDKIRSSDACLKGPVGETAKDVIVFLRQRLDLYANIRPFKTLPGVSSKWKDVDLVIVRENTEDLYKCVEDVGEEHAVALMVLTKKACLRISNVAFQMAESRRKKVTLIHKINVLRSFELFRKAALEVARSYPSVIIEEMLVDNAAYQLVTNPQRFDVMLTTNMFGDILSDEAAGVVGSLGLAYSANVGDEFGLFEPVHGTAPDIDPLYANPIAQIMASKMMLEWLGRKKGNAAMIEAANGLENAVFYLLQDSKSLTPDLGGRATAEDVTKRLIDVLLKERCKL
ncbi:MAG: isocitrate/isopropylmalate dehydrogenase family protein [Thaumarchaeota archaeon]|jgi:3-isopropylmalate dehydrogenase|nr:isocitrate/isopropylmalate dehydrogenase family protein [Candidatus Terraquivivens yellowstonensis]MCL7400822.1 isocitrate/isopropylmalate dehydrogenase family protein [Candidatus Terraquivivens yellowstonensis]